MEQYRLTYLYDEFDGLPVGMQYRTPSMGQNAWHTYWFEKNLQGDIVAVYYQDGTKLISYTYDAWGNCTQTTHQSTGVYAFAQYNPFRYRGYYYDTTTGYYYLQSRYYNPEWGRFLNADTYLNGNGDIIGYNLFAYCSNNPVMFTDYTGESILGIIAALILAAAGTAVVLSGCSKREEIVTNPPSSTHERRYCYYEVPLYSQKNKPICWAVCQTMVTSYQNKEVLTQKEEFKASKNLAKNKYGRKWKKGGVPDNMGNALMLPNIEWLYIMLKNNGPMYARYETPNGGHLIVVTGVDVEKNIVYTNNPHGYQGQQSFEDFQRGYINKKGETVSGCFLDAVYCIVW